MKKGGDNKAGADRWFDSPVLREWRRHAAETEELCLGGLPVPAQAFILTALQREGGTRLVIASGVRQQEDLSNEMEAWGALVLFFPETELVVAEALPDQELASERLAMLVRLETGFDGFVLATEHGIAQSLPTPARLKKAQRKLKIGKTVNRDALLLELEKAGYHREAEVQGRGQYSVRGAVVDIFSWQASLPVRTEWMGDDLESIREFDAGVQTSVRALKECLISLLPATAPGDAGATLMDYLPAKAQVIRLDEGAEDEKLQLEFFAHDFLHAPRGDFILQEKRRDLFLDHLLDWITEKWEVAIFCNNEGEQKRLIEIVQEAGINSERLTFIQSSLLRGFVWPAGKLVVLSDAEIFGRYQTLRSLRKQERLTAARSRQSALDFTEWTEGDYVVHLNHGIAFYRGLQTLPPEEPKPGEKAAAEREVMVLEFAEQARLYVPLDQAYLVSKYVGVGKKSPPLDTLGGSRWERATGAARKAVMDYAGQLLTIQADRETQPGYAFPADTTWQREFEESFVYEETPDQLTSIYDSKRDMESTRPMDRLICGDVGFGKTEVAIRAVFKAVMAGKQAAFLVPTTVLAQQHFQNLSERFADYPIKVEVLSRFRTVRQQKEAVAGVRDGSVDVIVGTHRLLSKDVTFKDLGLVVVDEEQRFGVVQKERFKERFRLVDVLTLSATPIPRTLYLSLTGARDMSTIETPPANRLPVETIVAPYDERVIRDAIRRELARNGQVYFLHNRVQSIHEVADKIKLLVPEARVDIGHGQMGEGELEEVMERFVAGETDVLLSTTIIESGLDIPNANTILIDRADRFGLADLYQLRGRVGRAQNKAYAYLFLPRHLMTVGDARKRVGAIRQYSQLGAGFKIAMRDLEIRGAGNLLGTAQSGHITAVGFELYCQLLKLAVAQLKGERKGRRIDTRLDLDFIAWNEGEAGGDKAGAFLPRSYLPESRWRIDGYRRLAGLQNEAERQELAQEWRDRYGPLPKPVEVLLGAQELKLLASEHKIGTIETQGEKLILKKGEDFVMVGGKFPRLTASEPLPKLAEIKKWITSLAGAG